MKRSKGTFVSRKNIPCSIFGSHNQQHRERESANSMNENLLEEKRTVIKKNRLSGERGNELELANKIQKFSVAIPGGSSTLLPGFLVYSLTGMPLQSLFKGQKLPSTRQVDVPKQNNYTENQ
ncbi:hypothetical protein AVEN_229282-1, partial [Araneus ventricosus]